MNYWTITVIRHNYIDNTILQYGIIFQDKYMSFSPRAQNAKWPSGANARSETTPPHSANSPKPHTELLFTFLILLFTNYPCTWVMSLHALFPSTVPQQCSHFFNYSDIFNESGLPVHKITLSPSWELELRPLGVATGNALSVTRSEDTYEKTPPVGRRQPMTSLPAYHNISAAGRIHHQLFRLHWLICLKRAKWILVRVQFSFYYGEH